MKYLKFIFYFIPLLLVLAACNQEDDICTEGGTPRMKVKYKKDGKLFKVDTLMIKILSGKDTLTVTRATQDQLGIDSTYIPLKVNGDGYTDILIRQVRKNDKTGYSVIRMKYNETSEYVSPGCGIRKLYDNVSAEVTQPNQVKSVELNTNQIHNESQTVLYFNF
ncbi:hypothetical protein BAX94_08635 [Elizabethkingia meningoseptica]|uniref:Lipoprotein n=1 Tax=Elizabethkingia meningoseptica TaxID=238 RepID=A0A1T3I9T3_ELIME|nr:MULTISPECIES: DUF6452 family protein [Elizabethkingia]AQX11507.1 hypothetical protein BBD35_03535 [Elizabethkingia meningoseptica]MBG0512857.1 hypothetical protein [Elizabethkingia meningoseptica]MDE5435459.1 hypothetical protein [Elizabethkingia meningoseptica]MDE5450934.1 hypothetical protein [Elizabethkingia meningoseptica]MDE5471899.1 hypothetical protein [Elizabethkingia meningoseptica]